LVYENEIVEAVFQKRLNRFLATVLLDGCPEQVHVKNTGRCKEILKEGTRVYLEKAVRPRKTPWSLVAAYKGNMLINIDSTAPNQLLYECLGSNKVRELEEISLLKKEAPFGESRLDFYFEKNDGSRGYIEVKGVTLEQDGVAMFPDAPTDRGARHLEELIRARKAGYEAVAFFLAQFKGAKIFMPNWDTDEKFSRALVQAEKEGVRLLVYDCLVTPNGMELNRPIPYRLFK